MSNALAALSNLALLGVSSPSVTAELLAELLISMLALFVILKRERQRFENTRQAPLFCS